MVLDIQDIINSVSVPALIKDDLIRQGSFLRLRNGDLQAYVGGFSVVFPVDVYGKKWAYRCWHRTIDDAIERIKSLSVVLKRANLAYLIDYDFIQSGITINGKIYPTTRMPWVEGITIKEYICDNRNSKAQLLELADTFLKMAKDMHNHSFAHGDLQHGNIIVNNTGNLYLVDYDSFYCPEFKGEADIITGLKDYQHPARKTNKITSEKIDYFSELIIYTSILGIAYSPTLVNKYQVEDSEHMLFESSDFESFRESAIYKDLKDLNPIFQVLLDIMEQYLAKDSIDDLEPFDLLMEQMTKAPDIKSFTYSPLTGFYVGDKVLLSWEVNGALSMSIDSKNVKSTSCERSLALSGNNRFILKATNNFNESKKLLNIHAFDVPEIIFSTNKDSLHIGTSETATISWKVSNSTQIILCYDGVSEEVESCGKKKITPLKTTTYNLKVTGLDKKRVFEKKIEVGVYAPSTVSFSSNKTVVLSNAPVHLSWTVENALNVELLGKGNVSNVGSMSLVPKKDTNYKLIVTDHFGKQEYSLPIKILPTPVINFCSAKMKLNKDKEEKTDISWDVKNASNVQLDYLGSQRNVKDKGSEKILLDNSSDVTLRCLALDGETFFEKKLRIEVFHEAVISFAANRKYTIPEVPIELFWKVENSKNVELKGFGVVNPQGNKELSVKNETTFTLVVTDEFTTQERYVSVKMLPLPKVKSITIPVPEINKSLNVIINVPKPETSLVFPTLNLPSIDFKIPNSPYLEKELDVCAPQTRPSFFLEIKNLFSHFFNR